ncbi:MAG: hydroxymethylbilane synthase [Chlamydiia bacterium]|nr:hydroxymethylbilane synthase [Chlamydiia bacterium]
MHTKNLTIRVIARGSPLSRVQVQEVASELSALGITVDFDITWVETQGDRDKATSLRHMDKSNFFTLEIDDLLLGGKGDIAVHSAKDLPEPLPDGLEIIALTRGVDPSDALVLPEDLRLEELPAGAAIGTSSVRREEAVRKLRSDLSFVDIRGTIGERLAQLDEGSVQGVVIAEAALIRLGLTKRNRMTLPGNTTPFQGQLAIVARGGDTEMRDLFRCIDVREEAVPHA